MCSVLVVHDVRRTTAGSLALKAYRLTDNFMKSYTKPGQQSAAHAPESKAKGKEYVLTRSNGLPCESSDDLFGVFCV
jgi:hypothetical protein